MKKSNDTHATDDTKSAEDCSGKPPTPPVGEFSEVEEQPPRTLLPAREAHSGHRYGDERYFDYDEVHDYDPDGYTSDGDFDYSICDRVPLDANGRWSPDALDFVLTGGHFGASDLDIDSDPTKWPECTWPDDPVPTSAEPGELPGESDDEQSTEVEVE